MPHWWFVNGTLLLVLALVARWLVRAAFRGWVVALVYFPLIASSFLTASEGSGRFDWHAAPLIGGVFGSSGLIDTFLSGGGALGALSATAAHCLLNVNHRCELRRPSLDAVPWGFVACGAALSAVTPSALGSVVGGGHFAVEARRETFWAVVFGAAMTVCGFGAAALVRRARWLRRVRRGEVPGYAVIAPAESGLPAAPPFARLQPKEPKHVLVHSDGGSPAVLAAVA